MAKGGDPSPVQPLYVGGNAYCGVPVAEQERDVVHIDAPLTIAVEESDDGPVVSVEVPAALASERVPIAATAEGSLAAMHSQEPDALDNAIRWVRLLWDTPIRTGTRRYYDNFLYAFAFLALAGEYRVW